MKERRNSYQKVAKGKTEYDLKKKKEIETRRHEKSSMLRKYAKLCKKEGIQSDRVNLNSSSGQTNSEEKEPKKAKTKAKTKSPFKKELQQAEERKQELSTKATAQKDNETKKKLSLKTREERRRNMTRRTSSGQPILGNQISSMLQKLQASKASSS